MKFLHSWLQEYIEDKLPEKDALAEAISVNAFEVEGIEEIENKLDGGKDYVYEINVLPNRAHDALSHYFMAKDIATILNLKFKNINFKSEEYLKDFEIKKVELENNSLIRIADSKSCTRFMGCRVENIKVKPSPDFIKYRLESIGQKSINNIVDITNYVQFSFNKPMHAYDANLVSDFLEARFAKEGEEMITLDEKDLVLDEGTLVIADAKNIMALAGIKGGKYSGISQDTKSIIVESANFYPALIRKTSQKYDLKTDASKRFENSIGENLVEIGMIETLKLIKEYASDENTKIEINEIEDNFPKRKIGEWVYKISVSEQEINNLLGTKLSTKEIENILQRFDFDYKYISTKENLELLIKEVLNKPYKNPTSMREDAPNAFSCSSLISYIYEGVYMPSLSIDKYLYTKGETINKDNLKFGDLIFRNSENGKIYYEGIEYKKGEKVEEGVDHVGMYVGEGKILHSSKDLADGTEIEDLEEFFKKGKIIGFGKVLKDLEEKRFVVSVPAERLDLRIKEDIIEEVGRVYGLHNIESVLPNLNRLGLPHKRLFYEIKIKNILFKNGFSEVSNYSLRNKGDITILKSVAQDKNKLRNNLSDGLQEAVQKNIFNLPLLDAKEVKIFEFGNVFSLDVEKEKEWRNLAIAIDDGKKNKEYREIIEKVLNEIKAELGVEKIDYKEFKNSSQKENCIEINFDELIKDLPEGATNEKIAEGIINQNVKYYVFPMTPFIVRDIACWTPENTTETEIENIIKENITDLCKSVKLFDKFEKEIDGVKKKSFAFRLIYQDENRTLTDEEVNIEADKVYNALKSKGFEIR
ncbi:Phenylalanine--tRNA ligase beta subunit [bioreactor metagenome]|uniref:phenylalanine--tRNA ligase n=1 Tax=bioreactor metagenome TaxID=1076179 RepID=A0A644V7C2_9ZZZZ|nr:phenylalanine--tRNA ligase beta subunit-related protein [Candidatus Elulimicrobiales bacterium]